jgi:nitrilase
VLIDPWGTVVAELADGEGVIVGEIDGARIAQVRRDLPALSHRWLA